jgi:hypothetical protein
VRVGREEAVDVQDSGAVEVDAVEVGANLVAGGRADQYWIRWCGRRGKVSLGAVFALVGLVVGKADPGLHAVVALELGAESGL